MMINAPFNGVEQKIIWTVSELLDTLHLLKLKPKVRKGSSFWYPVCLLNQKCRFQTPICSVDLGILKYKYEDSPNQKQYSINLTIDNRNQTNYNFKCLLELIDTFGVKSHNLLFPTKEGVKFFSKQEVLEEPCWRYFSAIRPNYNDSSQPLSVRVKIPCSKNLLNIQLSYEDQIIEPTLENLEKYIMTGCKVKCILEVNPLWYNKMLCGISYKLIALKIINKPIEFKTETS
jgi:hypothetical protein